MFTCNKGTFVTAIKHSNLCMHITELTRKQLKQLKLSINQGVGFLFSAVSWATAQVDIVVLETGEIAENNALFTAGSASDLFIDFRCDGNGNPVWLRRFPTSVEICKPFNQTMTSYDPNSGFLRVFSEYFRAPDNMRDGLAGFQCLRHFQQAAVNVRPRE